MIIREMRPEDLPQVAAIEAVSSLNPWSQQAFQAELSASSVSQPLVVEGGREVIAFIIPWLVAGELQIANFAVKPEYRKLGVGRMLLAHVVQLAKDRECVAAFLEVRTSNLAARELYRRLGFEEDGVRPRYYSPGYEDAILMRKDLKGEGE